MHFELEIKETRKMSITGNDMLVQMLKKKIKKSKMKAPSTDASYFLVFIEQDKSQADSSRVVDMTLEWMFPI